MDRIARTIKTLLVILVLIGTMGGVFSVGVNFTEAATLENFSAGAPGSNNATGNGVFVWLKEIFKDGLSAAAGFILIPFTWGFQKMGGIFIFFGGWFLDTAINLSLNQPLSQFNGIQIGWQVMRDFANLFFIFIILSIAIKTILQLGDHSTKQMLVRVIVVALLINFSAFFTKVVIDTGNVVAVGFYNRILTSNAPNSPSPNCVTPSGTSVCSISDRFNSALSVKGLIAGNAEMELLQKAFLYLFTGIVLFVIGAVFIQGGYFFIARTIAFAFLIIFSPIAFLAYAIPNSKASSFLNSWWSKLLNYTLLAPIYMIIMYLVLQIITQGGLNAQGGVFDVMNFILIIGLISAGSKMAFSFADSTGSTVANWASKYTSGAAIGAITGVAAYGARQTAGRWIGGRADNEKLNDAIAKGGFRGKFAQLRKDQYDKAAKGSWDVAQSKYGGAGINKLGGQVPGILTRGQGGFEKSGRLETMWGRGKLTKTQETDKAKRAKELFPDDAVRQAQYLKNDMGYDGYVDPEKWAAIERKGREEAEKAHPNDKKAQEKFTAKYLQENSRAYNADSSKNKDVREINRKAKEKARKKENEKILKENIGDANTGDTGARDKVVAAMQQLGPGLVAELEETMLTDIAKYLSRADLNAIHKRHLAGEYIDGDVTLTNIGNALQNATDLTDNTPEARAINAQREKSREYLASEEGRRELFSYRTPASAYTDTKKYKNADKNTKNAKTRKNQEEKAVKDLEVAFSSVKDAEGKHLVEDINSLAKEVQEHADFANEENGDGSPWTNEHTSKLNELTGRLRAKRREFEKKVQTSQKTPLQQVDLDRLRNTRASLDTSVSSAVREAAELDAQIDVLENGT